MFLGDIDFPKLKTIDVAQLLQVKAVYVSGKFITQSHSFWSQCIFDDSTTQYFEVMDIKNHCVSNKKEIFQFSRTAIYTFTKICSQKGFENSCKEDNKWIGSFH